MTRYERSIFNALLVLLRQHGCVLVEVHDFDAINGYAELIIANSEGAFPQAFRRVAETWIVILPTAGTGT